MRVGSAAERPPTGFAGARCPLQERVPTREAIAAAGLVGARPSARSESGGRQAALVGR